MDTIFRPSWSSLLFRGIMSILFGILALARPGTTLLAVVFTFGAYALVDGFGALVVAAQRGAEPHRWLLAVDGIVSIVLGVMMLLRPGITLLAVLFLMGFRFAITGALQIAAAFKMRDKLESPWLYGLAGAASILFGVLTLVVPGLTALVLIEMLGVFVLVFGVMMIGLALRVRSARAHLAHAAL